MGVSSNTGRIVWGVPGRGNTMEGLLKTMVKIDPALTGSLEGGCADGLVELSGLQWVIGHLGMTVVRSSGTAHALGFLAVGYLPPPPSGAKFDLNVCKQRTKKVLGHEAFGYHEFFSASDADEVTVVNLKTMLNVKFPADYEIWRTDVIPIGSYRASLTSGPACPPAEWKSPQERAQITAALTKGRPRSTKLLFKVQTSRI
ncbi:epoxide hydrolase [Moniliophthora roreri MCA 2997]|uniref:Epoxide hydrolase n=1 Tax=Moniliophthora roreri (strain MCA 2997) TaxID=1381753 RepID=V2XTB5_MONRO|nr:epoxide hydrolase [Moniliophthora roreri MCA 2997]